MVERKKSVAKKPRKAPPDKQTIEYWTSGEGLGVIEQLLKANKFDYEIADHIGVTQKTIVAWKKKYPTFGNLFLIGRKGAIALVKNALLRSALGFHEKEQVIDNKGKKQIVNKYYPPNVTAGIFLAKNWAPDEYKDKWDVDVNGKLPVVLSGDDEIED